MALFVSGNLIVIRGPSCNARELTSDGGAPIGLKALAGAPTSSGAERRRARVLLRGMQSSNFPHGDASFRGRWLTIRLAPRSRSRPAHAAGTECAG
jgi:hypothetical protein